MSEPAVERLPHGYTNATGRQDGVVRKSYRGPDPERRRQVERAALNGLRGRFPVPAVQPGPAGELWLAEVAGRHGQEALDAGHAAAVLYLCGQTRRRLSEIDPTSVPGLPRHDRSNSGGEVIVHGDFGPQNILLTEDASEIRAVVDWEWCHLGSAVEDLAWTEWIVRTHHRPALRHLDALFAGFGFRPPWSQRKAGMLDRCWRCRDFCRRWGAPDAVRLWDDRIAATEAFLE